MALLPQLVHASPVLQLPLADLSIAENTRRPIKSTAILLSVLSESTEGAAFCYFFFFYPTQVPMRELSSKRKTVALKMNFLKSLKVRMMRTSKEVSVSLLPGNSGRL